MDKNNVSSLWFSDTIFRGMHGCTRQEEASKQPRHHSLALPHRVDHCLKEQKLLKGAKMENKFPCGANILQMCTMCKYWIFFSRMVKSRMACCTMSGTLLGDEEIAYTIRI